MEVTVSWSVEVLDRNNSRFLNSPESCTPISLSWDDFSGPQKALICCTSDSLNIEDWRTRLGQDVRVYDPKGRLAWWGYLEQVSQVNGELHHSVGMREVANRVAVRYQDLGSPEPDEISQTDWVDNLESQAVYGIKEALYQAGKTQKSTAEWIASVQLADNAWPEVKLGPHTPRTIDTPGAYFLECRGWMDTLGWRVWTGLSAVAGHSPIQQGTQSVGNSLASLQVAQSFLVEDALQFNCLAVRARKQGNPTDSLRLSLQNDLNGRPSGLELGAQFLSSSELSSQSYGWVDVQLPQPVTLNVGVPYWLILERNGGVNSSNYYLLGLDENQAYQSGAFLIYDQSSAAWISRIPGADLLFRLTGVIEQVEQMQMVIARAGQFLQQFEADLGPSLVLAPLGDEGQDCLRVFRTLTRQGNAALDSYCSEIDPNRNLKIWRKPDLAGATLRISPEGRLETPFGQPLEAPWQAVGQWLKSETAQPLYLSSLILEPISAQISLNPRLD